MSKDWKIALVFLGLAFGVGYLVRYGCNKPIEKVVVIADTSRYELRATNAKTDTLHNHYMTEMNKKDSRIDYLEKTVKEKVAKIKWYSSKSGVSHDTVFINCEEQLGYANDAVRFYDSLATEYRDALSKCKTEAESQMVQSKLNKELAEKADNENLELIKEVINCGSYKHIIFRLYIKKK